jgi:16S rRNA (guanine527-N7)-methyltransferase
VSEASPELHAVLRDAQRLGLLGARPIPEVIRHARAFVDALQDVDGRVLDLGSGGGVPGLVIAHDRPDLQLTLVDRRTKRTDFLQRVVGRLGWVDHVDVVALDATALARLDPRGFAAVVARGFGPPEMTLSTALELVRPGGVIVVSEPPTGDRWSELPAVTAGVVALDGRWPQVARFRVAAA